MLVAWIDLDKCSRLCRSGASGVSPFLFLFHVSRTMTTTLGSSTWTNEQGLRHLGLARVRLEVGTLRAPYFGICQSTYFSRYPEQHGLGMCGSAVGLLMYKYESIWTSVVASQNGVHIPRRTPIHHTLYLYQTRRVYVWTFSQMPHLRPLLLLCCHPAESRTVRFHTSP